MKKTRKELAFIERMKKQRYKRGFSDLDTWCISGWFIDIMPKMLAELKEHHHGYPVRFLYDYYDKFKSKIKIPKEEFICSANDPVSAKWCDKAWTDTLTRMIFLFNEIDEEKCSKKNKYEKEYLKAFDKFTDTYGLLGEKLATVEEKTNNVYRFHGMDEVPEFKDISKKYHKEEAKLNSYRNKCQKEALEMFIKYFDDLWD